MPIKSRRENTCIMVFFKYDILDKRDNPRPPKGSILIK